MIRNMPVAIFLVAGIFVGWYYAHLPSEPPAQAAVHREYHIRDNILATGTVNPLETVQVGSQVSGIIQKVYVDYNSKVRRGQVLALIDPGPFQAQLREAEAQLENSKAQAEAARVTLQEASAAVQIAKEQTETQERSAEISASAEALAKRTLDHDEAQAQFGAASTDTVRSDTANYNIADYDRQIAEAGSKEAQLTISEKQAEIQQAQAQITAADAQVQQDKNAVETAKINLDRTEIRSPINGSVLDRLVSGGETVVATSVAPNLFVIVPDTSRMQVDADLSESDVGRVYPGQEATFTVDALPGQTLHALVRQIRKEAVNENNVISFDVVLDIVNPPKQLYPGMTAIVTIIPAKSNRG